ncbi:TPA: hypothetical protein ACTXXA_003103 [Legionella anisa]
MKPINALMKAISLSTKELNKLFQYNQFDENEANARHTLVYINAALPFYKQNSKALPKNEFALLLETIQSLPSDSKLLKELVHHLIEVNDLLFLRTGENRMPLIADCISKLPDTLFEQISEVDTSPTAQFIAANLKRPIKFSSSVINDTEIIVLLKAAIQRSGGFHTEDDDNKFLALLESMFKLEAIPLDKETEFYEELLKYYGQKRFGEKELSLIIDGLYAKSKDKEAFCKNFLISYKNAYDYFPRKSNGINYLLRGVGIVFPLLNEQLQTNRLKQILLDTKFVLEDPKASENDEDYGAYDVIQSFYTDNSLFTKDELSLWQEREFLQILLKGEGISSWFQDLGKDATGGLQLSDSPILGELPIFMQQSILNKSKLIQEKFANFVTLFLQVNQNAPEHQQRNITLFFSKHLDKIEQIINTMGVEGIYYLQNHLAGTVLNLERTLESVPILSAEIQHQLAKYFEQCHVTNKEHPEQIKAFKTCMIVISTLINLKAHGEYEDDPSIIAQFYMDIMKGKTPQESLLALSQLLLEKIMLGGGGVQLTQEEITRVFERIEPARFAQLAAASQHMADDPYREVYLELLRRDLVGGDINEFLHNIEQENEVGKFLAIHNGNIRAKLVAKNISPQTALNYQGRYDFIVTSSDESQLNEGNQYVVLWSYLKKLEVEAKSALDSKDISKEANENRIKAILLSIENLKQIINKTGVSNNLTVIESLKKPAAQELIKKIGHNLEALSKNKAETSSSFNEFADHFKEQVTFIEGAAKRKVEAKSPQIVAMNYFSVEQWSKEKLMTFFLGDEVGCCLATTSNQFQAMVQRRMDDALLFHVAVDQVTGRPAALIWLYLAETKEGKIVLMANFFEVNTKYAVNNTLRLSLLNGLLKFTEQYCKDNPGIDGFYMNPLSYGWNINDLHSYPIVDFQVADKLGGPFIPGVTIDQIDLSNSDVRQQLESMTKQKYYLVSLRAEQFHQFSPDILEKNKTPQTLEKDLIIKKAMFSIATKQKEISQEKLIYTVAEQHSLELAPFYSTPLEKDKRFIDDITKAIQEILLLDKDKVSVTETNRTLPTKQFKETLDTIKQSKKKEEIDDNIPSL